MSQNITPPSFQTFPNEILVNILQHLRPVDLHSASLVAKSLNDVVSSVLYWNLIWKAPPGRRKWTNLAFERRPWLREWTQQVLIDGGNWDIDQIKQACMELHNFPRLRKIHWVGKYGNKFTDFFGETEHIDTIEEIQLPLGTHNFAVSPYNPLIKLKSLIIPSDYITPQHPIWSGESKANLLSLCISQNGSNPPRIIDGCDNLQNLILENIAVLSDLMAPLRNLNNLQTLRFSFSAIYLESWANEMFKPFDLPYLHTLRMACYHLSPVSTSLRKLLPLLIRLYDCIASNSNNLLDLQLAAFTYAGEISNFTGDVLSNSILQKHRNSLRSLVLREFSIANRTLPKILHDYPQLEELEFSLHKKLDLSDIIPILATSQRLRVVRISIPRTHPYDYYFPSQEIAQLVRQNLRSQYKLYIRRGISMDRHYDCWEARWVYDSDLQQVRREIKHVQEKPDAPIGTYERHEF